MTVLKKILWVKFSDTEVLLPKKNVLKQNGYQLVIAKDFQEVIRSFILGRFPIVIISDDAPQENIRNEMEKILTLNEIKLSRFVLSCEFFYPEIMAFAAANNFRDLLPFHIDDDKWMRRLKVATMGHQTEAVSLPGQISLSRSAQLQMPTRIVYLNDSEMRIESHLIAPEGSELTITGGLCHFLGVRQLTFCVDKSYETHLDYRFSRGIYGKWKCSQDTIVIKEKLEELKRKELSSGYRIFSVVKDEAYRKIIFSYFKGKEHQLNAALNIATIADEQKYFSPHIIFIETRFCTPSYEEVLDTMLSNLDEQVVLVLLGDQLHEVFRRKLSHRAYFVFQHLNDKIIRDITEHMTSGSKIESSSIYLSKYTRESFARIVVSGQIQSIHPEVVRFKVLFELKLYALGYLSSPLLTDLIDSGVWFKCCDIYRSTLHEGCEIVATIVDGDSSNKESFARNIQNIVKDYYDDYTKQQFKVDRIISEDKKAFGEFKTSTAKIDRSVDVDLSTKAKAKTKPQTSPEKYKKTFSRNFYYILLFVLINIAILSLIIFVVPYFAKVYERSGSPYSESLKKFSGKE